MSLRDRLLDMSDRGRVTALAICSVLIIGVPVGIAAINAGHNARQDAAAEATTGGEEAVQDSTAEEDTSASQDESAEGSAAESGAQNAEEGSSERLVGNTENLANGNETGSKIDQGNVDTAKEMTLGTGDQLPVGDDTITASVTTTIVPDDVLAAVKGYLADNGQSAVSGIDFTITGDSHDEKYRQLAGTLEDGTLLCLEMPAGTNGPIAVSKLTTDDYLALNLGYVVGHDDEQTASSTATTDTTAEGGQQNG